MPKPRRIPSHEDPLLGGSIQSPTFVRILRRHAISAVVLLIALYIVITTIYVGHAHPHAITIAATPDIPDHQPLHMQHDACDALLQIPKVAMLFLTPGALPHERLWREWLQGAVSLLPVPSVVAYARRSWGGLDRLRLADLQAVCTPLLDVELPLSQRQHLFSLYVHAHPTFRGYRNFSMFSGHLIPHRIVAERGHHSLMVAEKLLLEQALREPLNQRFYLVSETTLPMYPAPLVYVQAMSETVSRVDACTFKDDLKGNFERWKPEMETRLFKKRHWRKTSQWFSLLPSHARLVVEDEEIDEAFTKYCFPYVDVAAERNVSCSSNEHYVAIVLAVHGLANQTTCWGGGNTHVDWTKMNQEGRPRSWAREEVVPDIVRHAREDECSAVAVHAALRTATRRFVHVTDLPVRAIMPNLWVPAYRPLSANCSLFMRKFSADTARMARETFRPFVQWPPQQ